MEKIMSKDTEKNEDTQSTADILTSSLLDTKKKHDQEKTVTKEEVDYLNKGADYLSSFLTGHGIEPEERIPTKENPLTEQELKKQYANDFIKKGYVTVDDTGRSKITPAGKEYFELRTKTAEASVRLAMLKNLKHIKSLKNTKKGSKMTKSKRK